MIVDGCPRCGALNVATYYGPCPDCVRDIKRKLDERMTHRQFVHCLLKNRWLA